MLHRLLVLYKFQAALNIIKGSLKSKNRLVLSQTIFFAE